MDDERTRQTLDSLAELFLTGTLAPAPTATAPSPRLAGDVQRPARSAASPSYSRSAHVSPLDGPEPFRLEPKTTPRQPSWQSEFVSEPHHPNLRLAGDDPNSLSGRVWSGGRATTTTALPAAQIEQITLGNLPGVSGPWLTQYAQHLADQHGPVAVVHVDGQAGDRQIELELVTPAGSHGSHIARPQNAISNGAVATLNELLANSAAPVRTILIHRQYDDTGEAAGDAARHPLNGLTGGSSTLLCGSDAAAIAAACQWITQNASTADVPLNLMIMGGDETASLAAADQIRDATSHHLHTPLQFRGWHQKIAPVHVRSLGQFTLDDTQWADLQTYLASLTPTQGEESPSRDATRRREYFQKPQTDEQTQSDKEPAAPTTFDETPAAVAAEQEHDQDAPDLTSFLITGDLPGSIALDARCPHQPATELLLDQTGRLHLLMRHLTDDGAEDQTLAALRTAIIDLLAARAWVLEHREVLALTQRQCRFDPAASPVLHLFTDRAALALALTTRLGGLLKLHLLHKIPPTQQTPHTPWISVPL